MTQVISRQEINEGIAKTAIMLADYCRASKMNGLDWWDMSQWKKTDSTSDEWNNAFNASIDPQQWEEDWREHIDFTTEEGTKRLAAWLADAKTRVNNAPTFHHSIKPGESIVQNKTLWYNALWFVGKTAISYAAKDCSEIETLYCLKIVTEWPGNRNIDGLSYVSSTQARAVLNKIKQDISNGRYLTWLKENAAIYNALNRPEPVDMEDW